MLAKLAVLTLAGAVVLAAPGCGSQSKGQVASTRSKASTGKTFEGDGYSFTYPETWATGVDAKYDAVIDPAVGGGGDVSLIVHRDVLTTPVTSANIDQAVRANRPAVDTYVRGGDAVLESGPTELTYAGLPGLGFDASLTLGGHPTRERVTWLFDRTTVYVFRCVFLVSAAEKVKEACDQVLNSFKIQ